MRPRCDMSGEPTNLQREGLAVETFRLSVIIAAYNEERTIAEIVDRVRAVPLGIELIAVNDASRDGTAQLLDRLKEAGKIDLVVHHERNRGKGAALRTGIAHATGDVIVVQDADLEYDPRTFASAATHYRWEGRCGLRLSLPWWTAPGVLLLAQRREQVSYPDVEHVHRPQPDRHGDMLQDGAGSADEVVGADERSVRVRA